MPGRACPGHYLATPKHQSPCSIQQRNTILTIEVSFYTKKSFKTIIIVPKNHIYVLVEVIFMFFQVTKYHINKEIFSTMVLVDMVFLAIQENEHSEPAVRVIISCKYHCIYDKWQILDQGRLCQTRNFLFVSNKSFWNYLYM